MSDHTGQTSSKLDTQLAELRLVVLTQQKKRRMREILPFRVKHYQNQDELNLRLNTARELRYHHFAVEQQRLLSLSDRASQVSRTAFLSCLFEIYGAQRTKSSFLLICDPLTNTYISFIYNTLFNPLSDTLFKLM